MLALTAKEAIETSTRRLMKRLLIKKDGTLTVGRFRSIARQIAQQESRVLPTAKFLSMFSDRKTGVLDEFDVQILLASCSHTAWEGTIDSRRFLSVLKAVNGEMQRSTKGEWTPKQLVVFSRENHNKEGSSKEWEDFSSMLRATCFDIENSDETLRLSLKKHKFSSNVKTMLSRVGDLESPELVLLDAKDLLTTNKLVIRSFTATYPDIRIVAFGNEEELRSFIASGRASEKDFKNRVGGAHDFICLPTSKDELNFKISTNLEDKLTGAEVPLHWTLTQQVVSKLKTPKDPAKSTPRDPAKSTPKDTAKKTPKDTAKKTPKDTAKKTSKDTAKKTSKDTAKKTPKDTAKKTSKGPKSPTLSSAVVTSAAAALHESPIALAAGHDLAVHKSRSVGSIGEIAQPASRTAFIAPRSKSISPEMAKRPKSRKKKELVRNDTLRMLPKVSAPAQVQTEVNKSTTTPVQLIQQTSKSLMMGSGKEKTIVQRRSSATNLTSLQLPSCITKRSDRFWTRSRVWRVPDTDNTDSTVEITTPSSPSSFKRTYSGSGGSFALLSDFQNPAIESATDNPDFIRQRRLHSKLHPGKCWTGKQLRSAQAEIEEEMQTWDFDIFQLAKHPSVMGSPLVTVAYVTLNSPRFSLQSDFDVSGEKMVSFLHAIEEGYMDSPYHNSRHAADVTQGMYYLISFGGLNDIMKCTKMEIMAILLATACHDVGHPGVNNKFLCATHDKTAIQFNDQHVLENMHCSLSLGLLHVAENNFLHSLSSATISTFRSHFIGSILATDLADHSAILNTFKDKLSGDFSMSDANNRMLALKMTIKAVDISHATRTWPVHRRFSHMINEEFFNQGDMEAQKGLPVSFLCDRHTTKVNKSQVGFLKFMISPFFSSFCAFLKSSGNKASDRLLENIASNGKEWQRLADIDAQKEKEEKEKEAAADTKTE